MNFREFNDRVAEWHRDTYGDTVNLPATYRKAMEEMGEVGEALANFVQGGSA